jgi:hypothetical protein
VRRHLAVAGTKRWTTALGSVRGTPEGGNDRCARAVDLLSFLVVPTRHLSNADETFGGAGQSAMATFATIRVGLTRTTISGETLFRRP